MSIKQLPAIGDSNWGTTLNSYLTQTTDNNNGGAFNQFDDINNRPINLTIDDQGKTYLNTRSGNFHEWSGTEWKILCKDVVNVYDFKNSGTDNTDMFEAAIAYARANMMSEVVVPAGNYLLNLTITGSPITLRGLAKSILILTSPSADDYAITYKDITGEGMKLENFTINGQYGRPAGPFGNGIRHIETTSKYGIEFKYIRTSDFKIGIYRSGSQNCKFYDCALSGEVAMLAVNNGSQPSGNDYYENVVFMGTSKSAIFYKNDQTTDNINAKFNHCWFEKNYGITMYAKGMGRGNKSFIFEQTWYEANVQQRSTPVVINGDTYNPTELILDNTEATFLNCLGHNGIRLTNNSYVKYDCTGLNSEGFEVDSSSLVEIKESAGESNIKGYIADFGSFFTQFGQGVNTLRSANNRPVLTKGYQNLFNDGALDTLPLITDVYGASGVVNASIVTGDSMYENRCLRLDFTAKGDSWGFNSSATPKKAYVCYSIAIKSLDTSASNVNYGFAYLAIPGGVTLEDNRWRTYNGICKADLTQPTFFRIENNNPGVASILLSKLQLVEFDTYQEAANYFRSDLYALPATKALIAHGDSIPIAGNATKGDIIYNTNPAVGSYTGWICTVAGTPGTWNLFGPISA
ncbi:MAG: hypothetical protein H7196_00040 [candidate division SR1 bacterium]|nr:hypothetical protein [candidate division SR1 bacterium]